MLVIIKFIKKFLPIILGALVVFQLGLLIYLNNHHQSLAETQAKELKMVQENLERERQTAETLRRATEAQQRLLTEAAQEAAERAAKADKALAGNQEWANDLVPLEVLKAIEPASKK